MLERLCNWQPNVQLVRNVDIELHWPSMQQIPSEEGWTVSRKAFLSPSHALFLGPWVAVETVSSPPLMSQSLQVPQLESSLWQLSVVRSVSSHPSRLHRPLPGFHHRPGPRQGTLCPHSHWLHRCPRCRAHPSPRTLHPHSRHHPIAGRRSRRCRAPPCRRPRPPCSRSSCWTIVHRSCLSTSWTGCPGFGSCSPAPKRKNIASTTLS